MKKIYLLTGTLFFATVAFAQTSKRYVIQPQRPFKVDLDKPDTNLYIKNLEAPAPGSNFDKDYARELKKKIAAKYPKKYNSVNHISGSNTTTNTNSGKGSSPLQKGSHTDSLVIGNAFYANPYNFSVPSDNSMGISDSGVIVSCINSSYYFYNTEDTVFKIANGSLESFSEKVGKSVYDPKVIYDPKQDRFIVVMLKEFSSVDTNEVVVAFSSSNDPMDDWYVYSLTGNPNDTTQWSDYPAISITDNELFITVNLISDTASSWITGFNETVIWQVDKNDGYNNQPLTTNLWSNFWIDSAAGVRIRNLHPIRNYNNYITDDNTTHTAVTDQYFLSNRNFAEESDTIMLVHISGEIGSNPTVTTQLLNSSLSYHFPVNGDQRLTPSDLLTNDARVLGAVYNRNNDLIQFVQHVTDTSTGNVAVYHGKISNASVAPVCTAELISEPGVDYGYPNMASTAVDPTDNSVMICYNYTSADEYPGHAARLYSEADGYTDPLVLKTGSNRIYVIVGDQRWGDYSGIQRRYNDPGKVWFEGIYGKNNSTYGNWISEIYVYEEPIASVPEISATGVTSKIYPNPSFSEDLLWFYFEMPSTTLATVEIYDQAGRKVTTLYNDNVKSGKNLLTLDTRFLGKGNYVLLLKNETGKQIVSKKIVRN